MEAAAPLPPGPIAPAEHPDLRDLLLAEGPFLNLYLTLEPDEVDAPERLRVRWRNAERHLREADVPTSLIVAAEDAVLGTPPLGNSTLAVIASSDGARLVEPLPVALHHDLVSWDPLPRVGPVIEARQARVAHVLVLIDRSGADVFAVSGEREEAHREVQGDSSPIEKNAPGGWSQPRYQRRADTSWEENAAEVAGVVCEVVADIDADLIVVAGDVRAVELLRDALPREVADLVHVVHGSRHPDGSADATAADVVRLVDTVRASTTAGLLEKLREELGQHDRAAAGPEPVLSALAQGQVQALLVHDDPDDDRMAWFGSEPLQVGLDADAAESLGAEAPRSGRLVDVALRAAFGSGAGIRLVPDAVDDGIAALLRWAS